MSWKTFLAGDPFITDWLNGRPENTVRAWASYMRDFRGDGGSPETFVELPVKEARKVVWRFVEPISRKYPGKALNVVAAFKNLYRWANDGDILTFDNRRGGKHFINYVRNGDGHIPSRREVYRVADCAGSLKGTAMVLTAFQSGIRPNALCGLRFHHVREQLEARKVPLRLKITPDVDTKLRSYSLEYYVTWVQGEAVQALKAWVDYEMEHTGWQKEDFLFHTNRGKPYLSMYFYQMFRRWLPKAGLNPRRTSVYDLRKAFFNVLVRTSMSDPNFKEALMGHKLAGSRGNYFDNHDLEALEKEYMKANFGRYVAKSQLTVLREVNVGLENRVNVLEEGYEKLLRLVLTRARE